MAYEYFIFDKSEQERPLNKITEILESYYLKIKQMPEFILNDKLLTLDFDGYKFKFLLVDDNWIVEESKEILETSAKHRSDKDLIAACKTRIEFSGDDDFDMDYFNESLFILDELSKSNNYVFFDYQSGIFYDEI